MHNAPWLKMQLSGNLYISTEMLSTIYTSICIILHAVYYMHIDVYEEAELHYCV